MSLKLIKPDKKYLPSVYEAVEEYKAHPSRFQISEVRKMISATENSFADYFQNIDNEEAGIGLKPGYVPQSVYWLVDDSHYIGVFALRHSLSPNLEKIGGHIAYQIRPTELRKGYAVQGLKLCLKEAYKKGIEKALITCNADNAASYGVMHKAMSECGGYEDTVYQNDELTERRVWVITGK